MGNVKYHLLLLIWKSSQVSTSDKTLDLMWMTGAMSTWSSTSHPCFFSLLNQTD